MKVLITSDWGKTAVNGVAASIANLEKGLVECGADVRILTLSPNHHSYVEGNTTYMSSINANKIYPNARISAIVRRKLLNKLIQWGPDIIHSQCEFSTFLMARRISKRAGCPIVHTYHTNYEDYMRYIMLNKRLGKRTSKTIAKHISRQVDGIIAPTEKVSEMLIQYGCHSPIWVMPTGLDLEKMTLHGDDGHKAELKKSLGIAEGKKIILYAGRIAEEKNVEELVEMLGRIRPENAIFLIVGDGPARRGVEKAIKRNNVDFAVMTGMVKPTEMRYYYSMADVYVSASQSETQGLTYIEALANGLPLLCKWDKCLQNVLVDGETGYAYANFTEFETYLKALLNTDVSKMRENAVKLIEENYSIKSFAEHAMKIYNTCINNRSE